MPQGDGMSRQYVLVERSSQVSRLNSVTMWRLVFYSLDDGTLWEMTVDSSYRNFRGQGWDHIVEDDNPWGVYEGLRRTQRTTTEHMPILTADAAAQRVWRAAHRDEALRLVEADQAQRNPDMFRELFA